MYYSVITTDIIRLLVAAEGGQAFRQQAGERRRRASSLPLASPPVATRNGLACLLPECAILTHKLCYRPMISNPDQAGHWFLFAAKFDVPNSSKIQNTDAVGRSNKPPSNQNATSKTKAPARHATCNESAAFGLNLK